MKKVLLSILTVLATFSQLLAQKSQADEIFANALKLYENQQTTAAVAEFEKVIALNPRHKDATYNLALINLDLGNRAKAIELLQVCVRLRDMEAARLLTEELHQKIAYADTMHLDQVDQVPKLIVKGNQEEILIGQGLNKVIEKSLVNALKKSKLLRKQVSPGTRIALSLYFGKDGSINAEILFPQKAKTAQFEITEELKKNLQIIPGKHDGKEVIVRGVVQPVNF